MNNISTPRTDAVQRDMEQSTNSDEYKATQYRDLARKLEYSLVDLAEGIVLSYKDVLLRSTVEQHLYDCARALLEPLAKAKP